MPVSNLMQPDGGGRGVQAFKTFKPVNRYALFKPRTGLIQIRNPKHEIRNKREPTNSQIGKFKMCSQSLAFLKFLNLDLLNLFWISRFEFSPFPPAWCTIRRDSSRVARFSLVGYTLGMKTAISIPDKIFAKAERLSRRLKKSRSQVFTEAVTQYIARHDPDTVTEAMNGVCEAVDTYADPAFAAAARRTLEDVEW